MCAAPPSPQSEYRSIRAEAFPRTSRPPNRVKLGAMETSRLRANASMSLRMPQPSPTKPVTEDSLSNLPTYVFVWGCILAVIVVVGSVVLCMRGCSAYSQYYKKRRGRPVSSIGSTG